MAQAAAPSGPAPGSAKALAGGGRPRGRRLIARFAEHPPPAWALALPGPFRDASPAEVAEEFLSVDNKVLWLRWSARYMDDGTASIAVPRLRWEAGKPRLEYSILVGDPGDAFRLARAHPAKDPHMLPGPPQRNVVNTADVADWRRQRAALAPAFMPLTQLSRMVPGLDDAACGLVRRWGRLGTVDAQAEMHHFALTVFCEGMLGVREPFGRPLEHTAPADSAAVRGVFNLEMQERSQAQLLGAAQFAAGLRKRAAKGGGGGPLIARLEQEPDAAVKMSNLFATLVAGHDTTAYTMQMLLLELARHPEYQRRARLEAHAVLGAAEREGRGVGYADLRRYDFLTRLITETLRLWNVAIATFSRVTERPDTVASVCSAAPVDIPTGTPWTFWIWGHHHSRRLWGADALRFNPDRPFLDSELQRGPFGPTAKTPVSARYHPFSLPTRDCLGKNFAMMEMWLLIPRILRGFEIRLAAPTDADAEDLSVGAPAAGTYLRWARRQGAGIQPAGGIWLRLSPPPAAPPAPPPAAAAAAAGARL